MTRLKKNGALHAVFFLNDGLGRNFDRVLYQSQPVTNFFINLFTVKIELLFDRAMRLVLYGTRTNPIKHREVGQIMSQSWENRRKS